MALKDKHGQVIQEFDLLKVFHFTGSRRKKYFMYKWVIKNLESPGMLFGLHLEESGDSFWIGVENGKDKIFKDYEIIQSPKTLQSEIELTRI